jgi:adenylate kinase family enzyme
MYKKTCIVLVGGPCSGKSSAGKLAANKLNAKYISSGDIAREMAKRDKSIDENLSNGRLAPEWEMRVSISNSIKSSTNDIIILDGFPRFGEQAEWLESRFGNIKNCNYMDIYYVLMYTPLSTIIERSASRNRNDDKSIEQRIKYYYSVTYKELYDYIDTVIDACENTANECSELLINFIREVTKSVKNS